LTCDIVGTEIVLLEVVAGGQWGHNVSVGVSVSVGRKKRKGRI
jgi:hypothetical protein